MSNRKHLFPIAFILSSVIAICTSLFAVLAYPGVSWASPNPYQDVTAKRTEGAIGSWGYARTQTYSVTFPLDDVQLYYDSEMDKYCLSDWQFDTLHDGTQYSSANIWGLDDLPDLIENSVCLKAKCEIRRWFLAQEFEVLMCSTVDSPKQNTIVVQKDFWED